MKKEVFVFAACCCLGSFAGNAQAGLTTIGTATYNGTNYDLIYDNDNNGNGLVWLDYSNARTDWTTQKNWAASLESALTINLNPSYSITWEGNWRLPSTVDAQYAEGTNGTTTAGYNITNSELGHLFYTELGSKGRYDTNGVYINGTVGLVGQTLFSNLKSSYSTGDYVYWSDTEYSANPDLAWNFRTNNGEQRVDYKITGFGLGVAVHSAHVNTVPVPGASLLLGSALLGLAGLSRRKKTAVA